MTDRHGPAQPKQISALCGEQPTITGLIDYDEFCGITTREDMSSELEEAAEISVSTLKTRLDKGERPVLLDVREPFEWNIANLADYGATLIPLRDLSERMGELVAGDEIVVYCRSGARSARAVDFLRSAGFGRAVNLRGGILAWAREIDPAVPTY